MRRTINTCMSLMIAAAMATTAAATYQPIKPFGVTVELPAPAPYRPAPKPKPHPVRWRSTLTPQEQNEYLVAMVMIGECRGQGVECMRAVGWTIMNRVSADTRHFGRSIRGVVFRRLQFSCWYDSNRKAMSAAGKAAPHSPLGIAWTQARGMAHMVVNGRAGPDPTHGATFYHAPYVSPKWKDEPGMVRTAQIAGHIFYRKG